MHTRRDVVVPVRLNEEETRRLDILRWTKGLSRSAFLRMALLEKLNRESPLSPTVDGGESPEA